MYLFKNYNSGMLLSLIILSLLSFGSAQQLKAQENVCPEAQKYIDKRKSEEQKGKTIINAPLECYSDWAMYYVLRCQCEQGVESEEAAKKLANKVNAKRQYLINLKKTECNLGEGVPDPVSNCKVIGNTKTTENTGSSADEPSPTLQYTGYEGKNQRLKDEYIRTFSSGNTYNAYVRGENIRRTGMAIASQLSEGLDQVNTRIQSSNPENILREFNQKIQRIEQLEANFNQQNNQYSFDAGMQLGESIGAGDWESGLHQLGGILNAGLEAREARQKLEAQKQALYQERLNKMSQVYWKAVDYNNAQRARYLEAAAYARDKSDEAFNLGFVENLNCFLQKMDNNFSTYNTNWLINDCPVPTRQQSVALNNTGVSEDEELIRVADRKYEYFRQNGDPVFREAAIAYASSAANKNPKPEYFRKLADYYNGFSNLLEYTNLLSARAFSDNPSKSLETRIKRLEKRVQIEVNYALDYNDIDYLITFLNSGLDDIIFIDGMNVLTYAVSYDKPDAVLTILNSQNEGKTNKEVRNNINNILMLSVVKNSPNTITRLIQNGVETDVIVKGDSPLDVANRMLNTDVFQILMNASENKTEMKKKYADSPIHVLLTADDNPVYAGSMLDSRPDEDIIMLMDYILASGDVKTEYLSLLGASAKARATINANEELSNLVIDMLDKELDKAFPESQAAEIISSGLLEFDHLPMRSEIGIVKDNHEHDNTVSKKPLSYEDEIDMLLEYNFDQLRTFEKQKQSEYLDKNIVNNGIKDVNKEIQMLEGIKNQDTEANRQKVYQRFLRNLPSLGDDELLREYGYYYVAHDMRKKAYTTKELVKLDLQWQKAYLNDLKSPDNVFANNELVLNSMLNETQKKIRHYEDFISDKAELPEVYFSLLYQYKPVTLFNTDNPLDAQAVQSHFGIKVADSGEKTNVNLAYYAWLKKDPALFHALDEQFDLSDIQGSDGKSLLESMITEGTLTHIYDHATIISGALGMMGGPEEYYERNITQMRESDLVSKKSGEQASMGYVILLEQWKQRKLFYSYDFDFTKKSSDGEEMFSLYLRHFPEKGSGFSMRGSILNARFVEMKEIIEKYDIDLSRKFMKDGGTFLHWFVDLMVKESRLHEKIDGLDGLYGKKLNQAFYDSGFDHDIVLSVGSFIQRYRFQFNTAMTNDNGINPYDYFMMNEDRILPYYDYNDKLTKTKKVMKEMLRD